jgi:hypothetical protein
MRAGLLWMLVATLVLSAVAVWWPDDQVQVTRRADEAERIELNAGRPQRVAELQSGAGNLPSRLPVIEFELARFDPFAGLPAPPPPKPKAVAAVVPQPVAPVQVASAPLPPPEAPRLSYRYLGQFTDPAGVSQVYLAKNDAAFPIQVGTRLEEGYVVEAMGAEGIRLHYPALNAHAVISVPAASPANSR